jgi:hypothetical protein
VAIFAITAMEDFMLEKAMTPWDLRSDLTADAG